MKKLFALLLCISIALGLSQTMVYATNIPDDQIIKNDESGIPDKNLYASMLDAGDSNKDGILTKTEISDIYGGISVHSETNLDLKGIDLASNISSVNLEVSIHPSNFKINNLNLLLDLHSLNTLRIYGYNEIDTSILSQLTNLSSLSIIKTDIDNVSWITPLTRLTNLSISCLNDSTQVAIDKTSLNYLTNLKYLDLYRVIFDDLASINKLINLETLTIDNCKIKNSSLNGIENFKKLKNLSVTSLKINNYNAIANLTQLTNLDLSSNNLTDINYLSNLVNLKELKLSSNNLTNINPLANLKQLEKLNVHFNKLTDVSALPNLTKLTELNLSDNKIETLPNIKNLTNLNFNGGNYVNLSSNRLSKEELLAKLPDKVKNYPKWLEENTSKTYEERIDLNKDQILPVNEINSLLKDKWVSGIHISSNNLSTVPQSILQTIENTNKYIVIVNYTDKISSTYWVLCADNVKTIQGDLNLTVENKSNYKSKIKQLTGQDNLIFATFKANQTLGQTSFFENSSGFPIELGFTSNIFTNDGDTPTDLFVYSYNEKDNSIKKTGISKIYPSKTSNYGIYANVELKKNENTIFISDKDGLETIKVDTPPIPDKPSIDTEKEDKVIYSSNIPTDELINALKDKNVNSVTLNITNPDTISEDLLNSIKESGKNVTFNILNEDNKLKYSWSFNGKDMKNTDGINLNLNIDFRTDKQKEIEKITKQKDMFYLQFAYHGKLPAPTTIKVDVSSQYKDGEYIYLYYFNEEKGTIEKASSGIKVENGYALFTIDHCSTYFFTKQVMKNTVNTSDNTQIYSSIALLTIAICGIFIMKKKKEI